jgi:hypothetical protein
LGNSPGFYRRLGFKPTEAGMWVQSPEATGSQRELWRQRKTPLLAPASASAVTVEL